MSTSNGKIDLFITQLTDTQKIYFNELDHLVENGRWLTTLIMAEIAGIAAYRKLLNATNLSIPFTIIIILLGLTIGCFMISVIISRNAKKQIANSVRERIEEAREIDNNGDIPVNIGNPQLTDLSMNTIQEISEMPANSRLLEIIGIVLFIVSSISTIIILFFYEGLKSIGF